MDHVFNKAELSGAYVHCTPSYQRTKEYQPKGLGQVSRTWASSYSFASVNFLLTLNRELLSSPYQGGSKFASGGEEEEGEGEGGKGNWTKWDQIKLSGYRKDLLKEVPVVPVPGAGSTPQGL